MMVAYCRRAVKLRRVSRVSSQSYQSTDECIIEHAGGRQYTLKTFTLMGSVVYSSRMLLDLWGFEGA
jgi:hypothetical protein